MRLDEEESRETRERGLLEGRELSRREFLKYAGLAGAVVGVGGGLGGWLAACGSSGTATTATSGGASGPGTGAPIKIGVATDITGVMAEDGRHHVRAIQMAAAEINAAGGLLGKTVDAMVVDTGSNTPAELVSARDSLKSAGVDMISTMWWFNSVASQYMLEVGAPMVQEGWVTTDYEAAWAYRDKNPNFVFLNKDEEGYGVPYFQALTNPQMVTWTYPNKKAAILVPDFDYSKRQATWWKEEAEKNGWEIVLFDVHPVNSVDYGSQMLKIRDQQPAIIYFCSNFAQEVIAGYTKFLEQPTQSLFCFTWVIEKPEFKTAMGEKGNGVIGTLPGAVFVDSVYKGTNPQYLTHYQKGKAFEDAYQQKYGEPPSIAGLAGYDGFWAWAEAVKRVGDVKKYSDVIKDMLGHDYVGITGTFGFDPKTQAGHYGADKLPINYYQMQDGKIITLALGAGKDVEKITDFQLPWWIKQ
ncbi:MAG: ABC transporter substrate-binding protein [Candidatus Marsarchaeota archaeon]|nr:ABC transporter substrate-binding protein [Candidatus Marsarchaeota archaeon]